MPPELATNSKLFVVAEFCRKVSVDPDAKLAPPPLLKVMVPVTVALPMSCEACPKAKGAEISARIEMRAFVKIFMVTCPPDN